MATGIIESHKRRSMRMSGYDYSSAGAYFVTVCAHHRRLLFEPLPVRDMIERWWLELPTKFAAVELDAYVIMPNHLHGILAIIDDVNHKVALPTILQWFKTMTTNEYIRGVKQQGWQPFEGHLWQPSYWDHIVRDEADMWRLREYIRANPLHWEKDSLNT